MLKSPHFLSKETCFTTGETMAFKSLQEMFELSGENLVLSVKGFLLWLWECRHSSLGSKGSVLGEVTSATSTQTDLTQHGHAIQLRKVLTTALRQEKGKQPRTACNGILLSP